MKPIKGFRLDETTQTQIAWLAQRKNVSATDVIRMTVAESYQQEMERLPKFKLEEGVLCLNGKPVIQCSKKLQAGLPKKLLLQLRKGEADAHETMLYLLLTAAKVGEGIEYNELLLKENIGWELPK